MPSSELRPSGKKVLRDEGVARCCWSLEGSARDVPLHRELPPLLPELLHKLEPPVLHVSTLLPEEVGVEPLGSEEVLPQLRGVAPGVEGPPPLPPPAG